MADVIVNFHSSMDNQAPLANALPAQSEVITSGAGSTQSAPLNSKAENVTIKSIGGAVWVSVGPNPTAAIGTHWHIGDGETLSLGSVRAGDRVAVIDA